MLCRLASALVFAAGSLLPRRPVGTVVLLTGLLAGCGGGFYVAIGDGEGEDRTPPSVNLAASVASVPAGQVVRLAAAAADNRGIDRVVFYRVDNGGNTLLGSDGSAPYEWNVTAPSDGRTSMSFFAHAEDLSGNATDSALVVVTITR
jgi:hypothetical protein